MDQDWQKKEAIKSAKKVVGEAADKLRYAKQIFENNDCSIHAMNISEALEYLDEVES
jgi:hypothetical protein